MVSACTDTFYELLKYQQVSLFAFDNRTPGRTAYLRAKLATCDIAYPLICYRLHMLSSSDAFYP